MQQNNQSFPVVILSGGTKSRMFPLNDTRPKGSEYLHGKSIFQRTLDNLKEHNFTQLIMIVSSDEEKKLLEAQPETQHLTVVVQHEATGMGDALLLAAPHLKQDQFGVVASYHYLAGEVLTKMTHHQSADSIVYSVETDTPWMYGILKLEGERAVSIVEKPTKGTEPSNLKAQACYVLDQNYLTILRDEPSAHYSFETALDKYMSSNQVTAYKGPQNLQSLKQPWHLFDFKAAFENKLTSEIDPSAQVAPTAVLDETNGSITVAAGARIGDFTKIVGPCYIGENVIIGDYSFVRESSIEAHTTIGAKTEVVRSIVQPNSSLHFGYLADSILGEGVKVGAGIITANKRLDRTEIKTLVKENLVSTKRTALGTIIGPKAQLGIRVSTMPGVLIGTEAHVMPGTVVTKNIDHKVVFPERNQ